MNTYLIVFLIIHIGIITTLFLNILNANRRMNKLKHAIGLKDSVWVKSCMRARHYFVQSIISFVMTFIGEMVSFWLLWMAGAFDICK